MMGVSGEILLQRDTSSKPIDTTLKPNKYAPPSPRNIRPKGQFQTKKPKVINNKDTDKIKRSVWLVKKFRYDNKNNIINICPLASPLNPSIIFMACVKPAMTNKVIR